MNTQPALVAVLSAFWLREPPSRRQWLGIVVSMIGEAWAYFIFLSVAEIGLLLLIVWYAWTWPTGTRATLTSEDR